MKQIMTEDLLRMTALEICEYLGFDELDDEYYGILQIMNDSIGYPLDLGVMYEAINEHKEDAE